MRKKKSEKKAISLGNYYNGLRAYGEAINAYNKVLEINPQNADVYYKLGCIYDEREINKDLKYIDHEKALEYFHKAVEYDPHHIKAWIWLTDTLRFKDSKLAVDLLKKAISYNPEDYSLYYRMGVALELRYRNREAIEYLHKSLELNPYYRWTWDYLSLIYRKSRLEANEMICSIFNRAFARNLHKFKDFLSNTSIPEFLQKLNDCNIRRISDTTPEEITQYFELPDIKETLIEVRINQILNILESRGMRRAKSRTQDFDWNKFRSQIHKLFEHLNEMKTYDRALELTNKIINTRSYSFEKILQRKAEIMLEMKDYDKALEIINDAITNGEHDFSNHKIKAKILSKMELYKEAIEQFKLSISKDTFGCPDSIIGKYASEPLEPIEPIERNSQNPSEYINSMRMDVVRSLGRFKLRQIGVFLIKIGSCYKKLKKFDEALEHLEKGKNLVEEYGDDWKEILSHNDSYWIEKAQKHISEIK